MSETIQVRFEILMTMNCKSVFSKANWIRYCVAQCLDLTNIKKADVCKYSQVSGLRMFFYLNN